MFRVSPHHIYKTSSQTQKVPLPVLTVSDAFLPPNTRYIPISLNEYGQRMSYVCLLYLQAQHIVRIHIIYKSRILSFKIALSLNLNYNSLFHGNSEFDIVQLMWDTQLQMDSAQV